MILWDINFILMYVWWCNIVNNIMIGYEWLCNYEYKYLKYIYELYLYMNSIFLKILL